MINRDTLNFYPEAYKGVPAHVQARKEMSVTIPLCDNLAVEAHIRNWLNSIAGTEKPIAPVQAGYEAVVLGLLSVVSFRNGKKVLYDTKTDKYSYA